MPIEAAGKRFNNQVQEAVRNGYLNGDNTRQRINNYKDLIIEANEQLLSLTALHARLEEEAIGGYRKSTTAVPQQIRDGSYLPEVPFNYKRRVFLPDGTSRFEDVKQRVRLNTEFLRKLRSLVNNAITAFPKVINALEARQNNVVMDHPNDRFYNLISALDQQNLLTVEIEQQDPQNPQRKVVKNFEVGKQILQQASQPIVLSDPRGTPGFGGLRLMPRNALNLILKAYIVTRHRQLRDQNPNGVGAFVMGPKFKPNGQQIPGLFINASFIDGRSVLLNGPNGPTNADGTRAGELALLLRSIGGGPNNIPPLAEATINNALTPAEMGKTSRRMKTPLPPGSVRLTVLISRIKSQLNDDLDSYLLAIPEIAQRTRERLAASSPNVTFESQYERQANGKLKMKPAFRKAYKEAIKDLDAAALKFNYALRGFAEDINDRLESLGVVSPRKTSQLLS